MKTCLTLTIALLFCCQLMMAQTIRIADNNPNHPTGANIYTSVQAAQDNAVSGDIIYVQPSLTSYGDLTINRKITLRGIGFNTGKDLSYTSTLGNINLTNKADNTDNASGTTIEGISNNDIYLGTQTGSFGYTLQNITIQNSMAVRIFRSSGYMNAQNITVKNCVTGIHFQLCNVTQMLVYGCFLSGPGSGCGRMSFGFQSGYLSSTIIANNFVQQSEAQGINGVAMSNVIITNNNFLGGNNTGAQRFIQGGMFCNGTNTGLYDVLVSNNIFYGCSPGSASTNPFERLVFSNNLSFGSANDALPPAGTGAGNTGSNNKVGMDPLFVNVPYGTAYAGTMDFRLQPSSPAKNAGSDGTDIGVTGGSYPLSGGNFALFPTSAPVIMSLNPASIVPQGQPVKTNIKAKSY